MSNCELFSREFVQNLESEIIQKQRELERVTKERDEARAERDASRLVNKSDSEDQVLIERMCASVLGQAVVDGNSMGVPGPVECVRLVIEKLEKERDEARAAAAGYMEDGATILRKSKETLDALRAELARVTTERDERRNVMCDIVQVMPVGSGSSNDLVLSAVKRMRDELDRVSRIADAEIKLRVELAEKITRLQSDADAAWREKCKPLIKAILFARGMKDTGKNERCDTIEAALATSRELGLLEEGK